MYYVYILTNRTNRVLYTGVTSNLRKRMNDHITKSDPTSFTARYNCNKLVWVGEFHNVIDAISYEKKIKAGSRAKKIALINSINPQWDDLANTI